MALTKITRGVIKANENYDTHNINSTGIVTAVTFTGNITGVAATFTGNVTIGGTLTYQDVTNIDSVGIITARAGVNVSGGQLDVGSNIKLGNAGVITATSYRGDGSQLTGISADSTKIETGNTKVETIDTGSDGHVKITTEGTERLRITSAGLIGIGTVSPTSMFDVEVATNTGINFTNVSSAPIIDFKANSVESAARIRVNEASGGGVLQFATKTTGGTITERLRILSDGKVAIGGVTANSQLDVHGGDGISITHSGDTFLQSRTTGTTGTNYLEFKDSGGGAGAISYHHNGDSMRFKINGAERARIDSDGHLQIRIEGVASMSGQDTRHTRYIIRQSNGQEAILGSVFAQGKSSWGGDLVFATKTADGNPSSGLTERLRITSNGDIGIGNITPGNSFPNGKAIAIGDSDTGIRQNGDGILELWANNQQCFRVRNTGNLSYTTLSPGTDNSVDLGTSSLRWRNIYTADLQMSNEGSANDVDGTWGKYTIQEGENDLFLINRRNGKKYKFNLTEVD